MARSVNMLRGLASGAGTGASIGSFIPGGTLIGAGVGAGVGLLSGMFSASDEEVRSRRISDLVKKYNAMKADEQKALEHQTQKNVGRLNTYATGQKAQANAGIARRAAASGSGGDNEAAILSSENNIGTQATGALQDIISQADQAKLNIDSKYNSLIANAEYENAAAPIEPNAVDVLETIAGPAMQFAQNKQYIDALTTLGSTAPTIPSGKPGEDIEMFAPKSKMESITSIGQKKPSMNPLLQNNNMLIRPKQKMAIFN